MGNKTKQVPSITKAEVQAPATTPPAVTEAKPATRYVILAPKRPLTGTKHGGGTASTHAKLCDAAKAAGGTLTYDEVHTLCKSLGDPGFAGYALRRLKVLVPQQAS